MFLNIPFVSPLFPGETLIDMTNKITTFVYFRLNAYYERVPGSIAVKNEVYAEYLATCSRYAIKNALNSTGFSDCIK